MPQSTEPELPGSAGSEDAVRETGFAKKLVFALVPLVALYVTSEAILSTFEFAPLAPSPKNVPIGTSTVRSPWGDEREIKEQIFIGAHTRFELPYHFRAFLPPVPKPTGVKRIVFLGDSFIFGSGLPDHEILEFQLSAYLGYYQPGVAVQMINLGMNGGGARTYSGLRVVADAYEPDLVVVGFTTANDFQLGTQRPLALLADDPRFADSAPRVVLADAGNEPESAEAVSATLNAMVLVRDAVVPRSRTLSAIFRPVRRFELGQRWDAYMERTYEKNHEAVFDHLTSLATHYQERGIPVILLVYPFLFSTSHVGINDVEPYRYRWYHDRVLHMAQTAGYRAIDLIDYFRAEGVTSFDGYQIAGDGHPNGQFNALVARHLARDLRAWSLP